MIAEGVGRGITSLGIPPAFHSGEDQNSACCTDIAAWHLLAPGITAPLYHMGNTCTDVARYGPARERRQPPHERPSHRTVVNRVRPWDCTHDDSQSRCAQSQMHPLVKCGKVVCVWQPAFLSLALTHTHTHTQSLSLLRPTRTSPDFVVWWRTEMSDHPSLERALRTT